MKEWEDSVDSAELILALMKEKTEGERFNMNSRI